MKYPGKLLLTATLCGSLLFPLSSHAQQEIMQGATASKFLTGTDLVRMDSKSGNPSYLRFQKGKELAYANWQSWLMKNLKISDKNNFTLLRTEKDKLGHTHYRYQQTFNGIPLEHGIWIVHTNGGMVYSMNGLLYGEVSLSSTAGLNEATALQKALTHVGATAYKWDMPGEEQHLKSESKNPNATYYPYGKLVFANKGRGFDKKNLCLAWKFNIYAHEPLYRADVYVDAATGQVIHENEMLHEADAVGTAVTAYSGTKSMTADSFGGGFRLRESGRGNGINTFDMNTGTSYGAAVDFTDSDNFWNNVNPQMDEVATDAHWGAEMTYDYFMLEHGRNSIDGAGFALNSYVHYNNLYDNAFWDGTRMTYGDGDGGAMGPLTSLDIAGHEISHGLTNFTAELVYEDESGALNESFSDIFGVSIEWYASPATADWTMGEDIGFAFRSMSNPNAYGDPDTYFGTNWAPLGGPDNGGVHTNSGVQNFWYYLLVNGGSGTNDNSDAYSVSGLGLDDASNIAFRNLTVYLTTSSDFSDARFYAIQSAIDIYGGCTPEVEATTNAWYAVGVGPEYVAEVVSDFSALSTVSCSAPFTVDFDNMSVNASTFSWAFGDGGTSTSNNPTHTYTGVGAYTVRLIADGGACGKDTLTMTNFITIDTTIDCEVILPPNGIASTQTACNGVIYDSGGPTGDYGANEDAQVTISPVGAISVTVSFPVFDIEPGTGSSCNYDDLTVYDGPNTSSPVIGVYCNNNIPTSITSTGGSITLVFHSDGGLELPGFKADWSCLQPMMPPGVNFTSSVDTTCSGVVNFVDLSTNAPSSWDWDFGDGGTSNLQNPSHTYTSNGLYTVTLEASNSIGTNTYTRTNYIYVNIPVTPTAVTGPGNLCTNETATLTASAPGGTVTWYTTPGGGSSVGTGSPWVTPPLTSSITYYASSEVPSSPVHVGPVDNTFGTGGNFTGDQHLIFDCFSPVVLKTVQVYASGAGNRTIELRNSAGTVLQSAVVNIPNGPSRITLNFNLPVGTDLELGIGSATPNLYRNNAGAVFPYTFPGIVSIKGTSATAAGYYYFFYDWELQEANCTSSRVPVSITVDDCSGLTEVGNPLGVQVMPNPATEQVQILVKDAVGKYAEMEIRNSLGQMVWSNSRQLDGTPVVVNVGTFGRGVYFVNMNVENNRVVKKLVVE